MLLSEIINEKILKEGPLSFHDFMEMCLYYPNMGYYTSPAEKTGINGDYYTSPNLSPAFGIAIARQLEEMWQIMGKNAFTIVECGAGTGLLCHDILNYLEENSLMYDDLHYCIIEKSGAMRQKEKIHLKEKVSWYNSFSEIGNFNGCVLANELLDNFSVHRVIMQNELNEIFVTTGFTEILQPAPAALKNYFSDLDVSLSDGFRTEINMEALQWLQEISEWLNRGFTIIIDYGYPSSELYKDNRRNGTLACYYKHRVNDNPYKNIGQQDITSHVNFSALGYNGERMGLSFFGFTDQAHFLSAMDFENVLKKSNITEKQKIILKHILLKDMGEKFHVLIQGKGVKWQELSGLKLN